MFSIPVILVGLVGLLVLVFIVLTNTPQAKAARAQQAKEYQLQEEQRREKEGAKAERMAQQMDKLRKQRLVVYIREKDGRKSSFEAVLIRMLLKAGITVESLSQSDGQTVSGGDTSKLQNGLLALVGTSWHKSGTGTSYDYLGDPEGTYKWESTYCDYRLLAATDEGKGKILGAGCQDISTSREEFLAVCIIHDLVSTFSEVQVA